MSTLNQEVSFAIDQIDETRRVVVGVVYAPNRIDAKGFFMSEKEVEKMAHRFMRLPLKSTIDTHHDNIPNGSYPVQSYIANEGDPKYPKGAWVMAVKIVDEAVWSKVISGEINAFSMEIYVKKRPVSVTYTHTKLQFGETTESEDHTHTFLVEVDEMGRVVKGKTSINAGHYHDITVNSITEYTDNHLHRYIF